jgi:hypothetical protein
MDMRFGTWNVNSLHTTGILKTAVRKLRNYNLGTGFFVHKRYVSVVRGVEFIDDTMSYII